MSHFYIDIRDAGQILQFGSILRRSGRKTSKVVLRNFSISHRLFWSVSRRFRRETWYMSSLDVNLSESGRRLQIGSILAAGEPSQNQVVIQKILEYEIFPFLVGSSGQSVDTSDLKLGT